MKKNKEKDKPKQQQQQFTDLSTLLVFGYSSKIFRDDAKALSIDRCDNFVPWQGDPKLKLDRYDGRIFLHTIDEYVPSKKDSEMEEYERAEEELCEEERWKSLYKNDEDEEAEEEEVEKRGRLNGEINYSYDQGGQEVEDEEVQQHGPQLPENHVQSEADSEDAEYVPEPELNIPPDMIIPPNMKTYSVILKTAKFLSTQGLQMEILLKAKQANNPAFQFLNPQDYLHQFYRHLSYCIKTKQFVPDMRADGTDNSQDRSQVPSQGPANIAPLIPTIQYKPSADCSYANLISRIRSVAPELKPSSTPAASVNPTPVTSGSHTPESAPSSPAAADDSAVPTVVKTTVPVTAVPNVPPPPPPLSTFPQSLVPAYAGYGSHSESAYSGYAQYAYSDPPPGTEEGGETVVPPGEEEPLDTVVFPPPQLQTIIDKMASYVARNGRTFEEVVRNKDKDRFSFLFPGDKHHNYYLHKLEAYTTGNYDPHLVPEPVAFKVKKVEDKEVILDKPSALPVEESESEEEDGEKKESEGEDEDDEDMPPLPPGEAPVTILKAEPKIYEEEEEKKRKEEEEKLRDRLAAAAREKMILNAKEKAMQLERKRKAAQFLAQLAEKKTTVSSVEPVELEEGELPVASWPPLAPPGPPGLVIPTLAAPVSIEIDSSDSDSSGDRRRKKRKRGSKHRSRSRSRDRKKRRRRSRSSRRKKKKKKDKSRRKRRSRSKSRSSRRSRSSSESRSRSRSVTVKKSRQKQVSESDGSIEEIPITTCTSSSQTKENSPVENNDLLKPALNQMKEDLRAKVRAMLGSST